MEEQEGLCRLSSALSYAISEWLLMLLLFVDGLFSYMVTKFAKYCKLQTPCLFCSRLDHILGSKTRGFYKNLICSSHKLEISSLAYCHIHQKLSDVRDMCEPCLLSFATERKTNTETYRSLVGKLVVNLENDIRVHPSSPETGAEVPSQNDLGLGPIQKRCCSCCKDHLGVKPPIHRFLQIGSTGSEIVEARNELLALTGPDCHSEPPNQGKTTQLCWKPVTVSHGENQNSDDPLSHFGYTKLKITSDSESEAPASDGHNGHSGINAHNDGKKDFALQSTQTELDASDAKIFSNSTSGKLPLEEEVHAPPVVSVITVAVPGKQLPSTAASDVVCSASSSSAGNEMKELNENGIRADEPSSCFDVVPNEASLEVLDSKDPKIADIPSVSSNSINEELKLLNQAEAISKRGLTNNDSPATMSGILGLNDTYKLVISNKGNETFPRDPSRPQEDLRLLLSQMSSARGLDFPWNEMTPSPSPRVHNIGEETKPSDGSDSSGLQIFTRRFSLERNESGLSSLDGSAFSEIEGENDVDRLKRLVEFEKKQLFLLYKELEEERSASAIAANQAMAMITRLQEEKAAMQMEALHYQRMMEEQAEYDHAALQKSNDLLAEREEELKDLKFEISTYRNQSMDMHNGNEAIGLVDYADEKETTPTSRHHGKQSVGVHRSSQSGWAALNLVKEGEDAKKDFLLNFEDERMYISKCLKKLENRLDLFSNNRIYTEECDILECVLKSGQNGKKTLGNSEIQSCHLDMAQENSQVGEDSGYVQNDTGPRHSTDLTLPFHTENCEDHPSSSTASNLKEPNKHFRAIDSENIILAFKAEIFQLSERLKALEGDRNFIEQAIN